MDGPCIGEGNNPWEFLVGFVMEEKGCRVLADLQALTWGLNKVVLSGLHAAVLWIKQCILHQGEIYGCFVQP